MGFEKQLAMIKTFQRAYHEAFGQKVPIDILGLKGIRRVGSTEDIIYIQRFRTYIPKKTVSECLTKCIKKHGASKSKILRGLKLSQVKDIAEVRALRDFGRKAMKLGWNLEYCAELTNRHRTSFYYYSRK